MRQVYNIGKIVILLLLFPFIILACKEKENDKVIENDERKVEDIVEQEDEVQDIEEQLDLEKIYVYDNELDTEDVASVQDIPIDTNGDLYALRKPAKKEASYTIDSTANKKSNFTGRCINISIVGMDARIGTTSKHADANHVLSIYPETGEIVVTSIPRDTYCDLGYEDSTGLNKLTICRSNKGRRRYLQEAARIARVNKIDYYVEFGFSQAMGIIEFLGYKNPTNTLQVLRTRKGFGDDYQRCYNQGQFIRQAMLSHFNKFTGTLGRIAIRAALLLVETNLTYDVVTNIVDQLEAANFPKSSECVTVKVRPVLGIQYKQYNFSDEENIGSLIGQIENFNNRRYKNKVDNPQPKVNVEKRLLGVIEQAVKDSAKHPEQVISRMQNYFNQRAWYQVKDKGMRTKIRDEFGTLLYNAYMKKNKINEANNVKDVIDSDKALFDSK